MLLPLSSPAWLTLSSLKSAPNRRSSSFGSRPSSSEVYTSTALRRSAEVSLRGNSRAWPRAPGLKATCPPFTDIARARPPRVPRLATVVVEPSSPPSKSKSTAGDFLAGDGSASGLAWDPADTPQAAEAVIPASTAAVAIARRGSRRTSSLPLLPPQQGGDRQDERRDQATSVAGSEPGRCLRESGAPLE